jgi:hypothetical protein
MSVLAKMKVDSKVITRGSTRPQEHFEEGHGYDCDCDWIPGERVGVALSVVTTGDGEDSQFAAATPVGHLTLDIDNSKAAAYFDLESEFYVEIRKVQSSKARS